MSAVHQVIANGLVYNAIDDLRIVYSALAIGHFVDSFTGESINNSVGASIMFSGVLFKQATDGFFALTGSVDILFPKLAAQSYQFQAIFSLRGYRALTSVVNIPMGSSFPIDLGDVALRRAPVLLQGRVVRESDRIPIGGATISSATAKVIILETPLYFDHASGVTVNARALMPAGPVRHLAAETPNGSNNTVLDSAAGLAPGDVLFFGGTGRDDIAVINVIGPAANQVVLQSKLNHSFSSGASVQAVSPAAVTGSAHLAGAAFGGEGVLVLDASLSGATVQIADGVSTEYHRLNTASDSNGFYQFSGFGGIAAMTLQAAAPGFSALGKLVTVNVSDPVHTLDFRLTP